ncbi:hypothetical protein [Cetobacterium sp.]|uniref:hypothetical protein n=1 Tax=Cetobacterium sp. TaxID=2071632 RepID=UPI003F372EA0
MLKNKMSFFNLDDIKGQNPEEFLKKIIPGINTDGLDVFFQPLNEKTTYNDRKFGELFDKILFQGIYLDKESMYETPRYDDVLYTLRIKTKGNSGNKKSLSLIKNGENYVLGELKTKKENGNLLINDIREIAIIPGTTTEKRVFLDLNNNTKILQSTTDIIDGVSTPSNARYSEIGKLINKMAQGVEYGNTEVYEKSLKTVLSKNIANVEHNNEISIGNLVSHKELGGIEEGYDISLNKFLTTDEQFKKLGLIDSREGAVLYDELSKMSNTLGNEVKNGNIKSNTEMFDYVMKEKLNNEKVQFYKINFREGKDQIQNITAISESGKEFTFDNFQVGKDGPLVGNLQYLREGTSNDSSILYHTIANDSKEEIRGLISNAQSKLFNIHDKKNNETVFSKKEMDYARGEAKKITNIIKTKYAETYGVDLNTFIANGGGKELEAIKESEIQSMILSGRNFDFGQNIGKQSQNTVGGVKRLQGSFAHALNFLNKEGQRKAQSIDQLSSVNLTDEDGNIFDVGKSINKIGEDIEQLKYKKLNVQSAQLNALNELAKTETETFGTSFGLKGRRAYVLYTNSDFAFQDSNAVSTQVGMAGAGISDRSRLHIDYASLNLSNSSLTQDEINDLVHNGKLNNKNIFVENTIENKLIRALLGDENYGKFSKKNEYIKEIENLKELMPKNLDLNVAGDRKLYVQAMEEITKQYNAINNTYLIKGNELGKATILGNEILNDGQLKTITKSNLAFIDDIRFSKYGIEVKTGNISLGGEGAKLMNEMVKLTVQKTNHLMGIKSNDYFLPVEMFIDEKTTAKKRGFTGSFITSYLQTAYTHAQTYGNQDMSDFDKYFREHGQITYNGKTTNVMDLLNLDISMKNGDIFIEDKTMMGVINKNIFKKDSLPYEDYLKNISTHIESQIGKINDKDSAFIGTLVSGKIEEVYENYINQFDKDKIKMQISFDNADIYSSGLEINDDGVQKITSVGKSYRFINSFTKMNESISRKDVEGLKIGRISNFILDEQLQTDLVEMIEGKLVSNAEDKITKMIGLTALPGSPFERGTETYQKTFGQNTVDISKLTGTVRSINVKIEEYLNNSPLGKNVLKFDKNGNITGEGFGSLTGFENELSNKFNKYFKNKQVANQELVRAYFEGILGSNSNWNKDKLNSIAIDFGRNLVGENGSLVTNSFEIQNQLKGKLINSLVTLGKTEETAIEIAENSSQFNIYKTLYGISNAMNIRDFSSMSQSEYDFLNNITKNSEDFLDSDLIKVMKAYRGEDSTIDDDILDINKKILKNLKNLNGENLFSLFDLKSTFEKGALPFFLDDISVDGQGAIVYNKELANIESLISNNIELTEIKNKKKELSKILQGGYKLDEVYADKAIPERLGKRMFAKTIDNLDEKGKFRLLNEFNISLNIGGFKSRFKDGGNLNLRSLNSTIETTADGFLSTNTYKMLSKVGNKKNLESLIENLEFTLKEMSGKGNYSNTYSSVRNDLDILKKTFNEFVDIKLNSLSDSEADGFLYRKVDKGRRINVFLEKEIEKIDNRVDSIEDKITSSILKRTAEASENLFKNKGFVYNAPTMKIKNSFAISPREGTNIINYITNEAEDFIGKGHFSKKYNAWHLDKNLPEELSGKYRGFKRALTLLYGEHYSGDILENILNGTYNKNSLSEYLNNLSGVVVGTQDQFKKLNVDKMFGARGYTYQALSRNPHQYLSSIRGTRYVMLDEETKNLSFFKNYFGGQTTIDNMQNNLMFVGKRTAMASHGDFDGDVFQGLFFSARDFGIKNHSQAISQNKILRDKMEYMNILSDISGRDLEDEILKPKLKGDFSRLLNLARTGFNLDVNSTNAEVFEKIKDVYYINKAEYIRTNLELKDEVTKHAILPELKKMFAKIGNEDIEIDKNEVAKIIGKMSSEEKLSLFLGNVTDEKLSNIDDYIEGNAGIKNYVNKYLKVKNETEKSKAFLKLVKELDDSKSNINWVNASLAKSAYADYTGINRTGIVHSKLSAYRESATIILHKDLYNNKYNLNIKGIDNNLEALVKNTIGFGSISEYIEGIGISAKLGGNVNPYETLNTFESIRRSFESRNIDNLIKSDKVKDITSILKRNMQTDINNLDELKAILKGDLTSKNVLNYITNGLGLDKTSTQGFIKLVDLEGSGENLAKYSGLQLLRGMSNLIAIYSNAELNRKNESNDVINGFRKVINASGGNLISRMFKLDGYGPMHENLGQNFRVVREGYKNIKKNISNFVERFHKEDETIIETITEHTNRLENSILSLKKKINQGFVGDIKVKANKEADVANIEKIETVDIPETPKVVPDVSDSSKISSTIPDVSESLNEETIEKIRKEADVKINQFTSEIESLNETINSKDNYIKNLETNYSNAKADYEKSLKEIMTEMENLREGVRQSANSKKARYINTNFIDSMDNIKTFTSSHKKGLMIGGGLAILGTFLRIFQSNRSVVKLNINEEEYQDEKMPLQRQFGGYEINTNIRSFYR